MTTNWILIEAGPEELVHSGECICGVEKLAAVVLIFRGVIRVNAGLVP